MGSLRLFLAIVVAISVTLTVLLGDVLHQLGDNTVPDPKRKFELQQTSLPALIKEYSLLLTVGGILYTSIYFWCLVQFQDHTSLGYRIATNFFVDEAGTDFAWISAGFYTSVLALSFFHPFESKRSYCFSNRFTLILAAVGGFGGIAGVGGVCLIIAADLVDIASLLFTQIIYSQLFLEYLAFVFVSIIGSYSFFFGLGSLLHWVYYVQQKNNPEAWKCQPKRWLSYADHRHEILLGTCNITIASILAGSIGFKIYNDQWTKLYFSVSNHGILYLFASAVVLFLYTEAIAYYVHRTFHCRFLYKNIHKWHHRYKAPTAFAALAIHPIEYFCYQAFLLLPIFVVPLHFLVYGVTLMYLYYFGMVDHSGIKFESWFPWQPTGMYHDDHHKYFHCNFGQNTIWFDRFHHTLRKVNKHYDETKFRAQNSPDAHKRLQSILYNKLD